MDLEQLLAELAKLKGEDVVKAVQEKLHPVFQAIYDQGHSAATANLKPKLTAEEAARKKAEDDLKAAQEANGDVKKVHEQYKAQITDLTTKHQTELAGVVGEIESSNQERTYGDLRTRLIAAKVDPDMAEVIVQKVEVRKRIKFGEKAKTFDVLQKDKDIPFVVATGKSPFEPLVEELVKDINPKFLVSGADRGGAARSGPSGEAAAPVGEAKEEKLSSKRVDYGSRF